ncbi:iron-containing alcohol dehydrogenase [Roseisolibacter sp. H3M3-2]|uniref:iron-containing alcohol dehydrogenase n=1 Tax=Roseisolibacter sp. H3M3-2 TaxID=3031323 RepID=UPI0023DB2CA0|nr:iron-containing alcohol dehydrogenase [Roseisolibacter sp. H3M3-2]MDF1503537.1 iron-containing alcohol dehydrogenase [Roseisolibacter sp. H3M3-2]
MSGFTFDTPPRLVCEDGAALRLGALARELGMRRPLVVTDRGLLDAGVLAGPLDALGEAADVALFADVRADPPQDTVEAAAAMARDRGADGVIGLGGGSSLDTAKLAALLARSGESLADVFGVERARGPRLPLIQVPTTAGTGSEVTPIAIVTTPTHEKVGVVARVLHADVAVLDATLTVGLPARVTAMTAVDAMVHAIEAYTSRRRKNVLSDTLAVRALALLSRHLPRAVADGADLDARRALLQGAALAGMAFANAPVAAVHALAYPLGGHFGVPHGLSNALVLHQVLAFNLPAADRMYAELAPSLRATGSAAARPATGQALLDGLAELTAALPLERRLREVGVAADDLPMLARDAMQVQRLLVNNPRDVTYDDALAIYRAAL